MHQPFKINAKIYRKIGKRVLYERMVVPTTVYGAETWRMRVDERHKLGVIRMKCLRSVRGVTKIDS